MQKIIFYDKIYIKKYILFTNLKKYLQNTKIL
jgi:hypothetical protein